MMLIPTTVSDKKKFYFKAKHASSTRLFNVRLTALEVVQYLNKKPSELKLWVEAQESSEFTTAMEWACETEAYEVLGEGIELFPLTRMKRDENGNPVMGDDGNPIIVPQEVTNPETGEVTGQFHTLIQV